MSENATQANPIFEAFKFQPAGEPLRPMVFGAVCTCGETMFAITGLALNVDVPIGMDVTATCRCGQTHSILKQAEAVKVVRDQAAAAAAAGDQVEDALVVKTQPAE